MDASLRQARRFCDLLLRVALLDRVADQAVSLVLQLSCAADFVSYLAKLGQRVFACHSISSKLRASLVAIYAPFVAQASRFSAVDCLIG
jgi:hypothetical protein